jgi:hypothetical protein
MAYDGSPDFNLDIVGACYNIRKEAETLAGQNYAYNLKRKTGALDFITSPENGSVDAKLISSDDARKIHKLEVFYDQRTKPCQISTNCDQNVCDTGTTPVRKSFTAQISYCVKTPVRSYSNNDMVALCMDPGKFMRERGFSDLRAANEHLSERTLAYLNSEIGTNDEWDGTTTAAGVYKDIQLINSALDEQRVPLPGNWAEVILDYQNNQLTGMPAVIGQGNLQMFYKLHNMSCCNSATPYGTAEVDGDARFYLDQAANTVLGTDKFILAAYNAVHLLTFNENRNIEASGVNVADRMNITVPDPFGYPYDWNFDFYFDKCTKTWKSMWSLTYGFFNVFQADSFAASGEDTSPNTSPDCSDELDGMTGIFGYRATAA